MKKIILTMCGFAIAAFALAQELALRTESDNGLVPEVAVFSWNTQSFDFGKIAVNKPVSHEFTFTNEGTAPLIITSVQASCGCTVTSYSKDPIPPGGNGFVSATYNAAKVGQFQKTVTVNANTEEGMVKLTIQGEVVE